MHFRENRVFIWNHSGHRKGDVLWKIRESASIITVNNNKSAYLHEMSGEKLCKDP